MNIEHWLKACVMHGASDLHLSSGLPPVLRVDSDLIFLSDAPVVSSALESDVMTWMSSAQQAQFKQSHACDFSIDWPEVSRFRVNVFQQSRGLSVACRRIAHQMPSLQTLHAPEVLSQLVSSPRGLVLITGPTGSGKSTTLAAMLDALNQREAKHIITIEDPIEFVHTSKRCLIQQRELGSHTLSFADALRAALREDPDVILVGEMRDLDTIRLAISAAETGHLVLATLHTSGAASAVDRMVDVFPAEEKNMVRSMLSESLCGVVSQVLCKRSDGVGRVPAFEVMLGSPAVRHLIREGKVAQLYSTIQTGRGLGMQTLDQALATCVQQGQVSLQEARRKSKFPDAFNARL